MKLYSDRLGKKRIILAGLATFLVMVLILFSIALWVIYKDVRSTCTAATDSYGGSCITALVTTIESEAEPFKKRNQAIWALGQIGDKRAIPVLKKLYTGEAIEKPCNTAKKICQYGVKKALEQCEGKFSLTRWMFRSKREEYSTL
jgi:hypothetical protein